MAETSQSPFEISRPEPGSDQAQAVPETRRPRSPLERRPQRVSFVAQTPAGEPEQARETKGSASARSQNGDKDLSAVPITDQSEPGLIPGSSFGTEQRQSPASADSQRLVVPSLADVPTRQEPAISLADVPTRRVQAVSLASSLPVMPISVNLSPETPLPAPVAPLDERLREPVEHYMQWLQRNNSLQTPLEKSLLYRESSMQMQKVGRREVRTFAPFQADWSALRVITPPQVLLLALLLLCWGVGFFFLRLTMITVSLGLVTVLYILGFITSSLLATSSFGKDSGEKIDEEIILALDKQGATWPMYTILCPLFKETAVVPQFVAAIKALNYPSDRLQVLFLTEEIDKETRAALYTMQLPPNFEILTVPAGTPQTKPRACNFGLLQAKGQFIVIFDAEDQPEPHQLKKAVLTFANHGPEVACVQAKLNYYNSRQNLLTRWFTAEYSTWFDIMLPGLQRSGLSLPLGGTSNHFRTEVLCALGGWDAFNVTEDCDLGLRISQYGLKTSVLDSTTYEEATSRFKTWLFQRSRWIKGYMQTYLVHMRHPLRMLLRGHTRKFLSLQLIVGVWTFVLLVNPVMWALTLCYIVLRPEQLYLVLFPGPVLYMGTFCLVFGNFFYIYIHFLGCLRRKEYTLIKWILLLPLYWVMMSISAYIAFYQLIVKPHYWEKTQHGNHLAMSARTQQEGLPGLVLAQERRSVVASMPTAQVQALRLLRSGGVAATLKSTTQRVVALRSSLTRQLGHREQVRRLPLVLVQDRWLVAVVITALVASITATVYLFQHHAILLYSDAYFHLRIARRIFDSATPGIGQLGTTWVPLPHLLMLPFVWNDYLWRSGLAGSIPAMVCYVVSAIYLYLSGKRLTRSGVASFIGTLVFVLNPNILYLQGTPLSELVCIVTFTMGGYYFLAWVQENRLRSLVLMAASTCLATMARYDGWSLFGVLCLLVPAVVLLKKQRLRQAEGSLLVFLSLGALGIVLWLFYNLMLSGNALYFLNGPFSSKVQTLVIHGTPTALYTYHNLWQAVRFYSLNVIETVGPLFFGLGLLGLVVFLLRRRSLLDTLVMLVFWVPFGFYVLSLYEGQAALFVPGAVPSTASLHNQFFNARFGSEAVVPIALCVTTLLAGWKLPRWQHLGRTLGASAALMMVIAQALVIATGGIITLEDGLYGVSCDATHTMNIYLAQHYNGGKILEEVFSSPVDGSEANFDFKNIVWEGSYKLWPQALADPASYVDWIIVNPTDPSDLIAQQVHLQSPQFQAQFTLVLQEPSGWRLYHKIGLPPLPTRPIPAYLLTQYRACDAVLS